MDTKIENKWTLYYHLINNNNWDINSYEKLCTIDSIDSLINHYNFIDEEICKKSMLFLMRENINPIWEDDNNINGATYSFKIQNKIIENVWKNISNDLLNDIL